MKEIIVSYAIGLFIPIFDFIDFSIKFFLRSKVSRIDKNNHASPTSVKIPNELNMLQDTKPYKVLVSVRNITHEFDFFQRNLGYFGYENVLVIDDHSTDNTADLLSEAHIPHIINEINLQKPGSILKGLREIPPEIETVVVIDPDTRVLNLNPTEFDKSVSDFQEVLTDFQRSGFDACAVRVVAECKSFIEKLQNFEYKVTMGLSKKSLRQFVAVSGAIAFYNRTCLERVLEEHSKSVYGEDYENSLRIHAECGKIYYDGRLTVMTSQRSSLRELTKQRMGWDLSLIKNHFQHFEMLKKLPKKPLYLYQYLIYNTGYLVLFHPVRLLSGFFVFASFFNLIDNVSTLNIIPDYFFNNPFICIAFYFFTLMYAYLVLLACERRRRKRYILLPLAYPFYSLYLSVIPKTLGYLNYISLALFKRKLIEDGYNSVLKQPV